MPAQYEWPKGFVQRANRSLYEPGELLDAVNMVPDPDGGGIATRFGDAVVGTVGAAVHSLYTTYTAAGTQVSYQGAGTVLYRYFTPIVTGLDGTHISFATMSGFSEKKVYTFLANGQEALRLKDDGVFPSNWGLKPPTNGIFAGVAVDAGAFLEGHYAWRQVYVRKPVIPGGLFGRWVDAANAFSLGAVTPFFLSDGGGNNGTVFGAPEPWDEVVLPLTLGTGVPGGQVDYSYWNGSQWVVWITTIFNVYTGTLTSFRNNFSFNAWVPYSGVAGGGFGLYLTRLRVLVNPPVMPQLAGATWYDGVYAARSNPSPASVVSGPYGPSPLPNQATVTFSSSFVLPDNEQQATHVAIYRTTGDDAAVVPGGAGSSEALYFFEREYPMGANTHVSISPDSQLGELLELDNDRPPAFETIAEFQQRIFGAQGNRLFFSKRHLPESFPGTNFLYVGSMTDPIQRIAQYHGNLYIWTKARVFILLGDSETTYDTRLVQCPTGLGAPQTIAEGERAIYFLGADGHLWALQGTIAANISRQGHQQLFEGITLHDVPGMNTSLRHTCVGHWGKNRYYLSYPLAGVFAPNTSVMLDETRGSWWRDTRGWQSMWYDRQADLLYGGLHDGNIVQLDFGFTDRGVLINGTVQTLDDDHQLPNSDKDLTQLVVDYRTSASGVAVTPVVNYVVQPFSLGGLMSLGRDQAILPVAQPGAFQGVTLGYVLAGLAPWALYGLQPTVLRLPTRLRKWQTQESTWGYAGPKLLESLLVDLDLRSGTFSWQVLGDGIPREEGQVTLLGRQLVQLVHGPYEATIWQLVFHGTGVFVLYDSSVVSWRPLPPPIYTHVWIPSDFGTMQDKIGLSYALDIDMLGPGTLTTRFYADGVEVHHLLYTTVGRQRTERFRMPATMHGRLLEIRTQSTALYRLYQGTDFEFQVLGATASQHYRPVSQEFGTIKTTSLLQMPHSEEG